MKIDELKNITTQLTNLPVESEWVEFKENNCSPEEIGKRISALANGACLSDQRFGYLVFGIEDNKHEIKGTRFKPKQEKVGGEDLEHWLIKMLSPKIDFRIYEFDMNDKSLVLLEIPAATNNPVRFRHKAYIRIGSYTKELTEYPEKERQIWNKTAKIVFETKIAKQNLSTDEIVKYLDIQKFFDLTGMPFPATRKGIIDRYESEKFIIKEHNKYSITNLGAILFGKDLRDFERLTRKSTRTVTYKGKNRANILKDKTEFKGYAVGFENIIEFVNSQLPSNEEIGKALRKENRMLPEIAIRELIANAIIHQDFTETGTGVLIELFDDRLEITNPGKPLITTLRFIDEYKSRNEKLADCMRRMRICEELGSGIDKAILDIEKAQLPAPEFLEMERHTKAILFAHIDFKDMSKNDRIRCCYQHCCLRYVSNDKMTNKSLRERFQIDARNSAMVSRVIDQTIKTELIKNEDEESTSKKYAKYIPAWA
jgi:ATP-dependent DNA helicase RecG